MDKRELCKRTWKSNKPIKITMNEYQKINTVFKRDMTNKVGHNSCPLIIGDWSQPEFELLQNVKWDATEKIDGTNIRVLWDGFSVEFKGRTDRADIPKHLLEKLRELFSYELMKNTFGSGYTSNDEKIQICLYGEGYGKKIQVGGNYIKNGVDFILFDIKVGKWYLKREDCQGIAESMDIKHVPLIGRFTLHEAIEFVKSGFKSTIAENTNYEAEGLVLKLNPDLFCRNGQRLITKIKAVDFK